MQVAAQRWERVFSNEPGEEWNLTVRYGWGTNLDDNLFGQEFLLGQGGVNIVRMTNSLVLFNRQPPLPEDEGAVRGFFADPTPWNNSAYTVYETTESEFSDFETMLPVGHINVGRVLSGARGLAKGRIDLFTIAMHEIGHSLGLDTDYVGHKAQAMGPLVIITPPRPLAGAGVGLNLFGDHIDLTTPLMIVKPNAGKRQLISGIDALTIAQFSSFDRPYLGEPAGVPGGGDDQGDQDQDP
jgi:hypothetical protein